MKRTIFGAAAALALAASAPCAQAQSFINVLTGGTSGVYYPLGVAIGKIYGDKIPNVKTQVQATKASRSEEHTSELQSHVNLVCRLLLEKKKIKITYFGRSHATVHLRA